MKTVVITESVYNDDRQEVHEFDNEEKAQEFINKVNNMRTRYVSEVFTK